jgi:L-aspartate oxidase
MIPTGLAVGSTRWRRRTDVVVVGSGAAGLSAVLALTSAGTRVTLMTKDRLGDGSTAWAQGGLAAVMDPADTVGSHADDTLAAGGGLSEKPAVADLVAAAPSAIRRLTELGARLDHHPGGSLALGLEGGHRARRIVHAGGDASGAEIARVLSAAVRRAAEHGQVEVLEDALAVDALTGPDGVCGLRLVETDGTIGELQADAVILATGGIGQAWPMTSNPPTATGDGLALALRAGALVSDVEFVQFHPTVLVTPAEYHRPGDRRALITEALRGEGARLVGIDGAPIMTGVHPLGDLAPRDVVAAAIDRRMRITATDHVLLDATRFGAETWRARFPTVLSLCRERGIDPRLDPIPVAPAAHYACGGVLADLDGVTSVPGLYAIGEVAATGVHGANRLASNSLTEALIAGRRVADLLQRVPPRRPNPVDRTETPPLAADLRPKILAATARGSAVLRHDRDLHDQLAALAELATPPDDRRTPVIRTQPGVIPPGSAALRAGVETTNLHTVSTVIAIAARNRTESRGCHRRSDFPEPRPEWQHHQLLRLVDGEIRQVGTESEQAA